MSGPHQPAPASTPSQHASSGGMRRGASTGEPATFVVVRHGRTAGTEAGLWTGGTQPGPGLSSGGRIDAARAADLVARIGRDRWADLPRVSEILASPTVRTQETAAAIGRRLGLHVGTEPDLREVNLGAWDGLTGEQIDALVPGAVRTWHAEGTLVAPGGESPAEVAERVDALLARLVAGREGRATVLVGHTIVVRSVVASVLGLPASSISRVRIPPGGVVIVRRWADGVGELVASGVVPG
ncbi:histidine phosphatase family protein [Sanguibacter massiliensis]|uniref:histidine phosphatase family protein n=1 Tax=Sanguibacter massiliensis TaxID=1973217 RepID=UPI001F5C0D77|nr:histidine phosphatase family protein [Sanguibacter massiliensis]